jgi:hypothetical protein
MANSSEINPLAIIPYASEERKEQWIDSIPDDMVREICTQLFCQIKIEHRGIINLRAKLDCLGEVKRESYQVLIIQNNQILGKEECNKLHSLVCGVALISNKFFGNCKDLLSALTLVKQFHRDVAFLTEMRNTRHKLSIEDAICHRSKHVELSTPIQTMIRDSFKPVFLDSIKPDFTTKLLESYLISTETLKLPKFDVLGATTPRFTFPEYDFYSPLLEEVTSEPEPGVAARVPDAPEEVGVVPDANT